MKGLELSKRYWEAHGASLFDGLPSEVRDSVAVGLVGQGSECLGFDDEASQDHDFGPGFCVWLPREAYECWGEELARRYAALPQEFLGYRRQGTELAGQRVGVMELETFWSSLTGLEGVPRSSREWLAIPEQLVACATNGEVFSDPFGRFSELRRCYLGFYPLDVLKKKVSADCASAAQAGQYNLPRMLGRGDFVAANAARAEFVMSLMACLHLLSRTYMPFYKWSFRSLRDHAGVPARLCDVISDIASVPIAEIDQGAIESLCRVIKRMVVHLGWASTSSDFLLDVAMDISCGIADEYLRGLPIGAGRFRA